MWGLKQNKQNKTVRELAEGKRLYSRDSLVYYIVLIHSILWLSRIKHCWLFLLIKTKSSLVKADCSVGRSERSGRWRRSGRSERSGRSSGRSGPQQGRQGQGTGSRMGSPSREGGTERPPFVLPAVRGGDTRASILPRGPPSCSLFPQCGATWPHAFLGGVTSGVPELPPSPPTLLRATPSAPSASSPAFGISVASSLNPLPSFWGPPESASTRFIPSLCHYFTNPTSHQAWRGLHLSLADTLLVLLLLSGIFYLLPLQGHIIQGI